MNFSKARRGSVIPTADNKTRITIRLDSDVVEWFKTQVVQRGNGSYQKLINQALRDHMERPEDKLETVVRRVVREELKHAAVG